MPNIKNANISAIQLAEQGSDPATPAAGFWRLYMKATGLYIIDDAGVVSGPFEPLSLGALGDIGDVDLTGLADGDVLQYNGISGNWEPAAGGGGGLTAAQALARTLGA